MGLRYTFETIRRDQISGGEATYAVIWDHSYEIDDHAARDNQG